VNITDVLGLASGTQGPEDHARKKAERHAIWTSFWKMRFIIWSVEAVVIVKVMVGAFHGDPEVLSPDMMEPGWMDWLLWHRVLPAAALIVAAWGVALAVGLSGPSRRKARSHWGPSA
jgi:hypothetical protein